MSGAPPPSPGPGPPGRQRSGLRALSGSLSLSAAASAWAEAAPTLRSELSQSHRPHQPAALAPFAMRPLDPAASLEMFKRMRSGPPAERASPAKAHAPLPLSLGDSARHTETEGGTPTSQRSLLESVDEGWGPPQTPAAAGPEQLPMQPVGDAGPAGSGSVASSGGQPSPFAAAAATRQLSAPSSGLVSPPSGRGSEALPPGLRAELLAQLSAMHAATAPPPAAAPTVPAAQQREDQGAGGGVDTPHSAASWPSMLSGTASVLPQTEAELQGLDAADVERLAADAAELQARAATALRLAQRRLQAAAPAPMNDGSLQGSAPAPAVDGSPQAAAPAPAVDGTTQAAAPAPADRSAQAPVPGAATEGPLSGTAGSVSTPHSQAQSRALSPAAEAAASASVTAALPSLPPAAQRLLQLYILLLAVAEALLLWAAQAVQAGSGGLLRVPRSLVLAPLAPARAALPALLLTTDACLVLLALLRGQRWAAAGL